MSIVFFLVFVFPAALMTAWTLTAAYLGFTRPLGSRMPVIAVTHVLLLQMNPKDDVLYHRPSRWTALVALVLGLLPAINLAVLSVHAWSFFTYLAIVRKEHAAAK